jgi:hypothetical protein
MRRVLLLAALWLVFAVASVGVGFTAAGLIEGPLATVAGPRAVAAAATTPATAKGPSATASAAGPLPSGATRGIATAGGYVSGVCEGGLIRLSASPEPGWELVELSNSDTEDDPDGLRGGDVEFEQAGAGTGAVSVEAWCSDGIPTFVVEADQDDAFDDDD